MWKNGKDIMSSEIFYSLIYWDMFSSKPNKSKNETKCECQKNLCVDRNTCHNMLCHSECEEN